MGDYQTTDEIAAAVLAIHETGVLIRELHEIVADYATDRMLANAFTHTIRSGASVYIDDPALCDKHYLSDPFPSALAATAWPGWTHISAHMPIRVMNPTHDIDRVWHMVLVMRSADDVGRARRSPANNIEWKMSSAGACTRYQCHPIGVFWDFIAGRSLQGFEGFTLFAANAWCDTFRPVVRAWLKFE